jgi:hypothetical protein
MPYNCSQCGKPADWKLTRSDLPGQYFAYCYEDLMWTLGLLEAHRPGVTLEIDTFVNIEQHTR